MDFNVPPELKMIQDITRQFTRENLMPLERVVLEREATRGLEQRPLLTAAEEEGLLEKSRELGLWGLDVPEEFDGNDIGTLGKVLAVEQLAYTWTPFTLPPDAPNLHFLMECCNEDQRERYLLPYVRGEKHSCLALTEPEAGADAGSIQTTAVRDGDDWAINGSKRFISFVDRADFLIVMAVTDRTKRQHGGITAFLVDKETPGLNITRVIPTISDIYPYEIVFDNCRVSDRQRLGEVGQGFAPLQNRLSVRRMEIGTKSVGQAQRAFDMMVDYARQRITFGKPLAERQAVQWWVTDDAIDIHLTRLLTYEAASLSDQGVADLRQQASMIKIFATEMLGRVLDHAMQTHGGMGMTKELGLEFMWRNARLMRVVEGPTEVHRWVVARNILR